MSDIFTVFGATGNQGGSVVQAILDDPLLSKRFKIRAVTRNASSQSAQDLAAKGIEVVTGDMSSVDSVKSVVSGAHSVFLVTNYWEYESRETEVSQGKNVTDACKSAGVQHLIFSSAIDATKASNGLWPHIPHFDGKAEVERYIRQSGVPATFILAGTFMTEVDQMLRKNGDTYMIALPVDDNALFPLIDVRKDTGLFVKAAIKNRSSMIGQRIYASTAYYTVKQILDDFSHVTGKPTVFAKLSKEQFQSFLPADKATEIYETIMTMENPGYYAGADLTESLQLLDEKPTEWKEYVARNRENWE